MVDPPTRLRRIRPGRWRAVGALGALGAAILGGACGGSSGPNHEAGRSAMQIFRDAQAATASASSVRVAGSGAPGGAPLRLAIVAARGRGGGSITTGGATLQLVLGGSRIYLMGDEASMQKLTGDGARAKALANTWLETAAGNPQLPGLGDLLNITELPGQFSVQGTLTKGAPTTFNRVRVLTLVDGSTSGTVYVAADGKPYIEGVRGGRGPGAATITFSDYGSARAPAAPAHWRPLEQVTGG